MYSFEHLNFVGNLKTRNGLFLRTKTHKNAKPGGGGRISTQAERLYKRVAPRGEVKRKLVKRFYQTAVNKT